MAILENLIEGFAGAAGADDVVNRIEQKKQRRQNLSDMELQTQTQQVLGDVHALQTRRASLNPGSPTYQQDVAQIDQALHDARGVFTDLYHPKNNPTALSKLGGFIQSHIGKHKGQQPATPAAAKASIGDRIAGIESAAYAPQAGYLTPEEEKKAAHIERGLEPRAIAERPEAENWVPSNVKLADGREITLQRNSKDGRWTYLDGSAVEPELLKGASVASTKPETSTQLTKEAYEGAFDPPVKWADMTPEQRSFFPRWKAMQNAAQTTGQNVRMEKQANGDIIPVTVQITSQKTFPGTTTPPGFRQAPKTPGVPKTPGAAKSGISRPSGAGVLSTGKPIGHTNTPAQTSADKKYNEAVLTDTAAKLVEQSPNDAVLQKGFAESLQRMRAGRFTTAGMDFILSAGWQNKIDQMLNAPTTGALAPDVVRQLVLAAHQNLIAAKAARDDAFKGIYQGPNATQDDDEFLKKF